MSAIGGAIAGGITAVILLLVTNGFSKIQQITMPNGDTLLKAIDKNGKPINVQLKNNAVISPQFDQVRITTSSTTFPNSNQPNFRLKNNSSVIKRIFALSLVPDPTFQADGIVKITLNEAPLFPITPLVAGDFQDISSLNIPIPDTYGLRILPKDELRVFIASPNATLVGLTVAVFIGELP